MGIFKMGDQIGNSFDDVAETLRRKEWSKQMYKARQQRKAQEEAEKRASFEEAMKQLGVVRRVKGVR